MEKTVKIRSMFLPALNEALQKLTLNDKVKEITPVIVEADGKFTSVIKTDNSLDLSNLSNEVDTEEETVEKENNKEQLLNKATDALKQTLQQSKKLEDILKKLKTLSIDDKAYNEWVVNEAGNTASLKSKNAYIFKQNNNLCLSHNGKIEIFKSVTELRKWLKDNKYPLPKENTVIKESKEALKEESKNWFDLVKNNNEEYLKNFEKEYLANEQNLLDQKKSPAYNIQRKANTAVKPSEYNKAVKDSKPPFKLDIIDLPDDEIDECFGGVTTGVLGSAVGYLANKSKKEESFKKTVLEAAEKSPWVKKILGTRLVEDDTPADFATGSPLDSTISSDMSNDSITTDTSATDITTSDNNLDDFNFNIPNDTNSSKEFGDIDISVNGGYSPEDDSNDEDTPLPVNTPDYKIIDVLLNDEDAADIKVKVQNTDTNEIEIKDLSEIDV